MTDRTIPAHLFVIFGATGDLAHRKLLPALFHLIQQREVTETCYVLGVSRSARPDDTFRNQVADSLRGSSHTFDEDAIRCWTNQQVFYFSLGTDDLDYQGLRKRIEALESEHNLSGARIFYLSIPPESYAPTIEALGQQGLHQSNGWTRLVIEKPFGHDLDSARALNDHIHLYFDETQVFRIDHYLGKETVQNLLTFRFANLLFESVWNRDRIERIEITAAETLGLSGRAGYYDTAGALRDMIQNHLTQLFTLVAMEVPSAFTADAIQREKIKVLESVQPIDPEQDVVLGQYAAGTIDDEQVPGYTDEAGIDTDTDTETYAAVRLFVNNWRWDGVPFYLRTGKRLKKTHTQIAVHFRSAPASIFQPFQDTCGLSPNELLIALQPDEGFDLRFEVKAPGEPLTIKTQRFQFRYQDAFGTLPDAYETLLLDVLQGDRTLFVEAHEAEAAWALYMPVLNYRPTVHPYPAGSWGPEARFAKRNKQSMKPERALPSWKGGARGG